MTDFEQLKQIAKPYRYRVIITANLDAVMPGRYGQIKLYSLDGRTLLAYTKKKQRLHVLLDLPWATRHQKSATGSSFIFPTERLEEMASILKIQRLQGSSSARGMVAFDMPLLFKGLFFIN